MLAAKPLKTQFIGNFVLIIMLSLAATALTYYVGYHLFITLENRKFYPANHFEQQIPLVEQEVRGLGKQVMTMPNVLEEVIPTEGFTFQVVDLNGEVLYGTDPIRRIDSRLQLEQSLNTVSGSGTEFTKIIPIFSDQGKLSGGVALTYKLTPYFINSKDRFWLIPMGYLILASPFLFFIAFTVFFAQKMAHNIGTPVNLLIEAADKVKAKDLDFQLEYRADNELGKLCASFAEMKNVLQESLISQWQMEQARHDLVESLAHDLKTPFTLIQGYAEALLEGVRSLEKESRYLTIIRENAEKGADLVTEMLYTVELEETMQPTIKRESLDLVAFLSRLREDYQPLLERGKIAFQLRVTMKPSQRYLSTDASKLARIFDNVISNSLKYTPENGLIQLDAKVEKGFVQFTVCDTGKGFSPQDLNYLFDKFYRGDPSRAEPSGGSGLGLYIAKQLVEMLGGTISAYNSEQGGACVQFALPFNSPK